MRDALYFLGEIARVPAAHRLAASVASFTRSGDDAIVRAAAWCTGVLTAAGVEVSEIGERELVDLARMHPMETIRFEAVAALGRAALARRDTRLVPEISRALSGDGSGRVRYGAMQSLRLLTAAGLDVSPTAAEHRRDDSDFGVQFERTLLLGCRR